MRGALSVVLLATFTLLEGCAFLAPRPQLTRRYSRMEVAAADSSYATVTAFALEVPGASAPEPTVLGLTEAAQAELIRALAARTTGAPGLLQALATPIAAPSAAPSMRDLTRVQRRVVFSIDNRSRYPADRISEARVTVEFPADSQATFRSWNRIVTRFDTVVAGTISSERTRGFEGGVSLSEPLRTLVPTASASASTTLSEEVVLRQRFIALTGTLTDRTATLLQQGATGIDVAGNVMADFVIELPTAGVATVAVPTFPAAPSDSSCIRGPAFALELRIVPVAATVSAPVHLDYVLRRVVGGDRTISESDDHVRFLRGNESSNLVLVPREMLRAAAFGIAVDGDSTRRLMIDGVGEAAGEAALEFGTYDHAAAMVRWLRGCGGVTGPHRLRVGYMGPLLGRAEANRLVVHRRALN